MWGVSFPHFHALGELMGNDQATGSDAEQFSDAIENMGNETTESMFSTSTEDVIKSVHLFPNDQKTTLKKYCSLCLMMCVAN